MSRELRVRWGWLKGTYIYTIVGAGGLGLGIIVMPGGMRSMFGWPSQDPIVYGVFGSVFISFALLSILGLRSPLKFAPVLLPQLFYKVIWFIGVVIPACVCGQTPGLCARLYRTFRHLYHQIPDRDTLLVCFCQAVRSVEQICEGRPLNKHAILL